MPKTSPALPGFYVLGVVTVGPDVINSGITLSGAFPNEPIMGETVATVIFCTHESNGANDLIYIGDLTMTSSFSATAAISLKGPNVIDTSLQDMGGKNVIPLGNIKIGASTSGARVRVSVLVA